ncbi:MAG: CoA transferase [Acidimicrobiia bacterium]|nr:CoA transferase [Acidimicrobiia bacterium]
MLEGIRVVELGVWVAGPGAGGVLADWGADVIKVEPPAGDPMRRMLAVTGGGRDDLPSPPFDLDNRGKRSVVLDLADADGEGRAAMAALIATADVFLTNLRPDAVARLGLDPAAVAAANPRLVYAGVTGYGRTGPDAHRAGYDVGGFWARSGIASLSVPADDPQPHFRGGIGDHVTAVTTVAGILAALMERERTGRGRVIETSLLRTGIWCLGWDLGLRLRFGQVGATFPRTETPNPMINPYRAGDGLWFWLLGVEGDRLWPKLVEALGREAWLTDERFSSARSRRHNAGALIALLDEIFLGSTRDEWTATFDEHDVWWAPVNTPDDVVDDPQAIATGAFVDVPAGAGSDAHRAVASPVAFLTADGGDDSTPTRGVAALGEHTAEVLAELGLG